MLRYRSDIDQLKTYFTNMDVIRDSFECVLNNSNHKCIFVIHGVGGVGKSTLLRIFSSKCVDLRHCFGMVSFDDTKCFVDALERWSIGLDAEKKIFRTFNKQLDCYRKLQMKAEQVVTQSSSSKKGFVKDTVKTAFKAVLETATFSGLSDMISNGTDASINILRGFMSKSEISLLLDPNTILIDAFADDIQRHKFSKRPVLMIDTFEKLGTPVAHIRRLVENHELLLVIAGQAVPDFDREWPDWLSLSTIHEVRPMCDDDMRTLVKRYHKHLREQDPTDEQTENIIRFARGFPLAVNTTIQLWVKYDLSDFDAVRPQVIVDLVERICDSVPHEIYPLLEAAATVRWFNDDLLLKVVNETSIRRVDKEFKRFPFVRFCRQGWALHDSVRSVLQDKLLLENPTRYYALHQSALDYFKEALDSNLQLKSNSAIASSVLLEFIYHFVTVNNSGGFEFIRTEVSKALVFSNLEYCSVILSEVSCHRFPTSENNWISYWEAELGYLRGNSASAKDILTSLFTDSSDDQLLISVCFLLGMIHYQQGNLSLSESMFKRSLELISRTNDNSRHGITLEQLAKVHRMKGDFLAAQKYHTEAHSAANGNDFQICSNFGSSGTTCILSGNLTKGVDFLTRSINIAIDRHYNHFYSTGLRSRAVGLLYLGKLEEARQDAFNSLALARSVGDKYNYGFANMVLGQVLSENNEFSEAHDVLEASIRDLEGVGAQYDLGNAFLALGNNYICQRDYSNALIYFERCESIFQEMDFNYGLGWCLYYKARAYEALNRVEESKSCYRASVQIASMIHSLYLQAKATVHYAEFSFRCCDLPMYSSLVDDTRRILNVSRYSDIEAKLHLLTGSANFSESNLGDAFSMFWKSLYYSIDYNCQLYENSLQNIALTFKSSHQLVSNDVLGRYIAALIRRWKTELFEGETMETIEYKKRNLTCSSSRTSLIEKLRIR